MKAFENDRCDEHRFKKKAHIMLTFLLCLSIYSEKKNYYNYHLLFFYIFKIYEIIFNQIELILIIVDRKNRLSIDARIFLRIFDNYFLNRSLESLISSHV